MSDESQALEARLGLRLSALLSAGTTQMQPDVLERLRFAREQALVRARSRQVAATAQPVLRQGNGLVLGGPPAWWQRALAVLPLAVLVGGLMLVQHASQRELVMAAADIDAVLLGDSLPPAAYSDPGFAEFLHGEAP